MSSKVAQDVVFKHGGGVLGTSRLLRRVRHQETQVVQHHGARCMRAIDAKAKPQLGEQSLTFHLHAALPRTLVLGSVSSGTPSRG